MNNTLKRSLKRDAGYHFMVIPGIIFAFIFCYIPMFGIIVAFKDFNFRKGFFKSEWAGLEYFKEFFSSVELPRIIFNTVGLGLLNLLLAFPVCIIFALLLNELRNGKFKRMVQTMSYFPHFISWVVVSVIMLSVLSPSEGIVNDILSRLGLIGKPILFLGEPDYYWWVITIANIWKETGWGAIIYIAAISGIDPSQYESAVIDGAGRFRRMWNITLPSIKGTIAILLILNVSTIANVGFEQALMLNNPLNNDRSVVLSYYVYLQGIKNAQFSFATAAGLIIGIVSVSFMLIANAICKKLTGTGLMGGNN